MKTALGKRSSTSMFGHRTTFSHPFAMTLKRAQFDFLDWPILLVQVNSVQIGEKDRIIGYGSCRIPMNNGVSTI